MGWRSRKTIELLCRQFLTYVRDAKPSQMRCVLAVFPRLHIPFNQDYQFKLYGKIVDRFILLIKSITPKDFTISINTFARVHFKHDLFLDVAANHITQRISEFSIVQIALIANGYARLDRRNLPLLRVISREVQARINHLGPQDLSNIANAFAKLDYIDLDLFTELAPAICNKIRDFQPQGIANVANAYAKAGIRNQVLFERLGKVAIFLIQKFNSQGLGNLANAYARLDIQDRMVFEVIADEVIYRATAGTHYNHLRLDFRSIDQLANAFAKLGLRDKRVFFLLAYSIKQLLCNRKTVTTTMDGQSLSMLLNAFAKAGMKIKLFHPLITYQAMRLRNQLSTIALSNILIDCNKLGIQHKALFASVLVNVKDRLEQFSPMGLVMLLRGFAKLNIYKRSFVRQCLKHCGLVLSQLDGVALCTLLHALADLRYRDPEFLSRLATAIDFKMFDLPSHHVCIALDSFARLRFKGSHIYKVTCREIFNNQHQLTVSEILSACNGLTLLDDYSWDVELLYSLLHGLLPHRRRLHISTVKMLQGLELHLRLLRPNAYRGMTYDLKDFLLRVRGISVGSHQPTALSSSQFHREVSQYFQRVGLYHHSEVRIGPYSLDLVVGNTTVFEVDGEAHFYRDTDMRTAKSLLKHKMLESMGWRVVHIPYQEWQQCTSPQAKLRYCAALWRHLRPDEVPGNHPSAPPLHLLTDNKPPVQDEAKAAG